jgi:Tfp pilus assembly protein PilF
MSLETQLEALMRQERWADAIQLAEMHLPGASAIHALRWNLGWSYFKIDEYSTAAVHLRAAAELEPESPSSHWALAFALLNMEEGEEAEAEFKRALELGDRFLAWLGLALLYLRRGDMAAAEQTHLHAIKRRPESRERVEAYADFLSDVGRSEEARTQYGAAAQLWSESRLDAH